MQVVKFDQVEAAANDRKQKLLDMEYYTTKMAFLKEKLAKNPEDPVTNDKTQRNQEKYDEATRALAASTEAVKVLSPSQRSTLQHLTGQP